ncbi:MAG: hypothetical protein U1E61_12965 [Bradyrhizobium sp.]
MKLAMKSALAASTLACAALLSFDWSGQDGVSLAVETAQARTARKDVSRSHVTGRPALVPRYTGGYRPGNYYCSYGVGCGYDIDNYYAAYVAPGFPASFYGVYGGYSDGAYGRYVNPGYSSGRPTRFPRD